MSNFISRGLKSVRKALHLPPVTLGNVATKYAPAAIMAASGNPMGAAATVYSGGAVPQKRAIPNVASFTDPTQPSSGANSGGIDWGNILGTVLGGAGNAAKKAGQYAIDNPLNVAMGGLAGARAIQGAKASARQGKLSDEAIALAKERWAGGAPLRTAGQTGLLKPRPAVDYNAVFADPTNPFASPVRRPITPTRPTPIPGVGPTGTTVLQGGRTPTFPGNPAPLPAPTLALPAGAKRKLLPQPRVSY